MKMMMIQGQSLKLPAVTPMEMVDQSTKARGTAQGVTRTANHIGREC